MYIDFHCDTLMLTGQNPDDLIEDKDNNVDLMSLSAIEAKGQFFAIYMLQPENFTELDLKEVGDREYILQLTNTLKEGIERTEGVEFADSFSSYRENRKNGDVSCFLTIEDGRYLTGPEELKEVYDLGVRLVSLTWNFKNALGYPNSAIPSEMAKGLTPWGIEAVSMMNELGMLIDVSHLSDGGFYDVAEYSEKPFLASHSNARAITDHPRNLTDDMIRVLADAGGVVGLNFSSTFLDDGIPSKTGKSRVRDMIRHLKHIKNVGGAEVLALGTDFDGIGGILEISRPDQIYLLIDEMKKNGFSEREIDGFLYKNGERLLRDTL